MRRRAFCTIVALGTTLILCAGMAIAGPLMEKAKSGQSLRIGFANEIPWAYPGPNREPHGFVNVLAIEVLKKMGFSKIEPVVTDWGSLIPGLEAGRFDIITGGMYITPKRCENVAFSEPLGEFGDAFVVPKGNPLKIGTYKDIANNSSAILVTVSGWVTVDAARKEGIPDERIMQVTDPTAMLQALKAGRAQVGGATYFTALDMKEKSGDDIEVTDPKLLPAWTKSYAGIAFRKEDADFLKVFNAAQASYLGTDSMLKAVEPFRFSRSQLPPSDIKTANLCKN